MSEIHKFFLEFKSIFTSKDVLKENEEHANIVVATVMFNIFLTAILIYFLTLAGVFNVDKMMMLSATISGIFTLLIPSIICFALKGKGKWLKYVLLTLLTIAIAIIYALLTYTATLLFVIPLLLTARYYSKRFTIFISIITVIIFGISAFWGVRIGLLDVNYIEVPSGTTISVDTSIENGVKDLQLDWNEQQTFTLLQSYLPKLFIYCFIIIFACIQVSQSGEKMVKRQKKLSEEGAKVESELNIARQIQKNMLPNTFPAFPQHKEFDIYACMIPAKEVGGDFYDMFLIDDNHLALIIADVSGKGVPAALIMMTARTLVKNLAINNKNNNVEEIFNSVNKTLCDGNSLNHFVTSWFGILDLQTGKLEYVNAGHNPPVIYSKKENNYSYLKSKPNLILGIMDDTEYEKNEIALDIEDKIFLYTDGVTEATSDRDELYGEKRLLDFLNNHKEESVTDTIKGVKQDIDKFIGTAEQFDDITMLELLLKKIKED